MNDQGNPVSKAERWNRGWESVKKGIYAVYIVSMIVIGFNNIVYANGAYVYKKLVYDNTKLHAQTIWKDINSIDGYIEGETQVVFMGDFTASKAAYTSSVARRYNDILTGAGNSAIIYGETEKISIEQFWEEVLI